MRRQLASLLVLSAAIVAGVAVFFLVGRTAGALYGGAALILGLIFHQKLSRGRREEIVEEPVGSRAAELPGRRRRRGRRAMLEEELADVRAQLAERDAAAIELAVRLDEELERTRALEASFVERIDELTSAVEQRQAELAAAHDASTQRLAILASELADARSKLAEREGALSEQEAALSELARERDQERARASELADRLVQVAGSHEEEQTKLAWAWRAHVEEIAALEAAVDELLNES